MFESVLRQELTVLNTTKNTPILLDITDDNENFIFRYSVNDEIIIITHKDTDIFSYPEYSFYATRPRNEIITELYNIKVDEPIDEDVPSKIEEDIDFTVTISPEVTQKINAIAHDLMSPGFFYLIDAEFLLNIFPPIIAYNVNKTIISNLQESNKLVPCHLTYALNDPQRYFVPSNIIHQKNIDVLHDDGAVHDN